MGALRKSKQQMTTLAAMTLVEHLAELRNRLVKCVLAITVGGTVMWWMYTPTMARLTSILQQTCRPNQDCKIIQTDPLQGLTTRFTICAYGGLALAMPVLLWQVWRFVTPGLYAKERRLAVPFVVSSVILFVTGASLALWVLPAALEWLGSVGGNLSQFYTPDRYVMFVVKVMIGFGIGFELPVFLVFLQLIGLVSHKQLGHWRRYALVGIVILVALGPTGDPVSLLAQAVPMYLLYEAAILIGWLFTRRKLKRAQA